MKQIALLILFLAVQPIYAQQYGGPPNKKQENEVGYGKITGKVVDATNNEVIPYATVALMDASGTMKNGTVAADNGTFTLKSIPSGTYTVTISFIGYAPITTKPMVITGKGESYDLGTVSLESGSTELDEVVIEGEKELVEEKVDRLVYNAEQDQTTAGGDAADVLRRVPLLSVDLDGNVSLRGSSNITVLIDNKPSTISASSIGDALKQIPADQIKSVEVITSPSARYDAEGTSGIINIITKKNNLQGMSLDLRSSAGNRGSNLGLRGNLRRGRTGFSLGGFGRYGYNIKGKFENSQTLRDTDLNELSTTEQIADTRNSMLFGRYNFGVDHEINKYNWVGISASLGLFNMKNKQDERETNTYSDGILTDYGIANVDMKNLSQQYDVNLNYLRTFEEKGKELSILGLYSQNDRTNDFQIENLDTDSYAFESGTKNINDSYNKEITVQLDYVEPIGEKMIFEVGGKNIYRLVNSDYQYLYASEDQNYTETGNNTLSNQFDYTQNITAGYVSYTAEFLKKYSIKAGVRYEHTTIDAEFQNEVGLDIPDYGVLVPSVNLSKKFGGGKTIKFAYNRRIQRPSLEYLNPNIQGSNPLSITQGNPELAPEYTNNFEVALSTYKKGMSLNISAFMRNTNGSIQAVRESRGVDTVYTTYQNIGEEDAYGVSLFSNVKVGEKFMVNGGIDAYYAVLTNNVDNPIYNAKNDGFVISGRMFGSYKFNDQWAAQFFGFIRGNQVQLQGHSTGFYMYSLGINRSFKDDKGSIGIGAENFLTSSLKRRTKVSSPLVDQDNINYMYNTNFKVTFSYKIGKLSMNNNRRKGKSIENNDLKGGDSNQGNTEYNR